jgi:hypothetical protein
MYDLFCYRSFLDILFQTCFNVIKVAAYSYNWQLVASYVSRAETGADSAAAAATADTGGGGGSTSQKEATSQRLSAVARLKAAAGLAELALMKYRNAARCFLQVT